MASNVCTQCQQLPVLTGTPDLIMANHGGKLWGDPYWKTYEEDWGAYPTFWYYSVDTLYGVTSDDTFNWFGNQCPNIDL